MAERSARLADDGVEKRGNETPRNETPQVPPGTDPFTESKLIAGWPTYGEPFLHAQVNRFRREMKRARVVELRDTNHVRFLIDPAPQRVVVREMRKFLLDE